MGHMTITTPLSGTICHLYAGLVTVQQCIKFQISTQIFQISLCRYARRRKMQKLGWYWG